MNAKHRSACPFSFALDHIGDRWSLLILRDMLFFGKRYYDEFAASDEAISTNILAARLRQLEADDLISKQADPENRRRKIYRPTEKALDLLPMMIELVLWSARQNPKIGVSPRILDAMKTDRDGVISSIRDRFHA